MKAVYSYLYLFIYSFCLPLGAQQIDGRIVNKEDLPIASAAVIIQKIDSTFICATTTDSLGLFQFYTPVVPYRVSIHHIAYKTRNFNSSELALGTIELETKTENLSEVIIKANHSVLRIKDNGGLMYDIKELIKNAPVSNALEILEEIPAIQNTNENYQLVGTNNTTIILNGRKSNMTSEQLKELLSNTPSSQVKSVEIYYSTPPQYGIRGASINVILDRKRTENFQLKGDIRTSIYQGHHYYQVGGLNLSLSNKQWSWDVGYNLGNANRRHKLLLNSIHTIEEQPHDIDLLSTHIGDNFAHRITSNFTIDLKKERSFSLLYYGQFSTHKPYYRSDIYMDGKLNQSVNNNRDKGRLQTINAEYHDGSWNGGVDAIFYSYTSDQKLSELNSKQSMEVATESSQKVKKFNVYINSEASIVKGTLSYGLQGFYSSTENKNITIKAGAVNENESYLGDHNEKSLEGFMGWSQKTGRKGILDISLTLEYLKAETESNGSKQTLWENFQLYPNLTYTYKFNSQKSLQLSISTEKDYPPYKVVSPTNSYVDFYYREEGNPLLKPYETYHVNINYILKNKYILGMYAEMVPNYYIKLLYQYPNKLMAAYKFINLDYSNEFGLTGVIPVKWNQRINSRMTADLFLIKEKGIFEDMVFNRKKITGRFTLVNNFILNQSRTLSFQLIGRYQLPTIEGIWDINDVFNCSANIAWKPGKGKWNFIVRAENLFDTNRTKIKANYNLQNYMIQNIMDNRYVNLAISYSLGGYKEKKTRTMDTSRMGF